ncbi:hypothetical protein AB0J80_24350 [Actinoplanes sp. NPDC049548]|uniref:hypothetical protein n=1 Tax=Actinoplanes sp. NPDC049548 TaxID=3155152 RepID=UPI003419C953
MTQGLSIEPSHQAPRRLVLKLGTSRMECILWLDHPEYEWGRLDCVYTLDCWLTQLRRLAAGTDPVALLPFNFSDQCTAWLRVGPLRDGRVDVQAGWSGTSQYDLEPADLLAPHRRIHDFEPVRNATIKRPLTEIVASVTTIREALAHDPEPRPWDRS